MPVDDHGAHAAPPELIGEHEPGRAAAHDQHVGVHTTPFRDRSEYAPISAQYRFRRISPPVKTETQRRKREQDSVIAGKFLFWSHGVH
jgi:hypothetical protein